MDEIGNFPKMIVTAGHVEPAPRRVRGFLGHQVIFDTTRALYVWDWPYYPQYNIPVADVVAAALVDDDHIDHAQGDQAHGDQAHGDEDHGHRASAGPSRVIGLRAGEVERPRGARLYPGGSGHELAGTVRFRWDALDAWFEEDEQIFVHPRNPYVRVDALRLTRRVRVELDGTVLAESASPVLVFETGLPTRHYLDPTDVDQTLLVPTTTVTSCPYKGTTDQYWSVRVGGRLHADLAWSYRFTTRELLPIAGLVAFYDEKVDVFVDDVLEDRPISHLAK